MAFTEFYIRQDGDDLFGGSSDSASADYVTTDCDSDGAGTTLTDNSGSDWSGVVVGDFLCFDSAGTPEYAQVDANPTATTLTISPAVALSATNKTCNVGGSWATIQLAADIVNVTDFINAAGDPPRVNIKYNASAWNEGAQIDFDVNAGLIDTPITFHGYETTVSDNGFATAGVDHRPTITNTESGGSHATIKGAPGIKLLVFSDLILINATGIPYIVVFPNSGVSWRMERCKITGETTSALGAMWSGTGTVLVNCEVIHTGVTGSGYCLNAATGTVAFGCTFEGGNHSTNGNIFVSGALCAFAFCVSKDSIAGPGMYVINYQVNLINCLFHNNTTSGVVMNEEVDHTELIENCGFVGNGTYGVEVLAGTVYGVNNGFSGNGTAATTGQYIATETDVTTDPGFADEGADDFTPGVNWKAAGMPTDIVGGANWTSYIDIGPVQRQEPAAGSVLPGGDASNYMEDQVVDYVFRDGYEFNTASVYLALYTSNPDEDNAGTEISGNGYARQLISFGAPSNGAISNDVAITFPVATGSWGTVTHFAVFDSESSGNMLVYSTVYPESIISTFDQITIGTGIVQITID